MMMIMMMMMMISIGSLLRSRCSWNTVRKISQQLQECYRQLCVLFHWQQSHKVSNPKGTRNKKKKGPPLLSFIHFVGSSFTLCLVTKPSLRPKRDRRHTPEQKRKKTKQNKITAESRMQVASRSFSLTCWRFSYAAQHKSIRATINPIDLSIPRYSRVTSPYPVCMHTCQILTRCQKKTSSNPLTSSLSVTYLFPFFPTTHTRTKKNGFPSSLNRERKENVCRHKNPDWIVNCYHWWPYFLYYKAYYTIRWGGWIE